MKKVFFVLFCALFATALFVGCGSTKQTGNKEWWHNEFLAGKIATEIMGEPAIAGVGASNLSGISAEQSARLAARGALAQRIGDAVSDERKRTLDGATGNEDAEKFNQDLKGVSEQVLSGAAQVDYYFDEQKGTTYVLMGLPLEGLDKKLQSASMKSNNKEVREFMNQLTIEKMKEMFNVR